MHAECMTHHCSHKNDTECTIHDLFDRPIAGHVLLVVAMFLSITFQTVFIIVIYIVLLPKPKECFSKSLLCDDFRGIANSSILSKVFEYCL